MSGSLVDLFAPVAPVLEQVEVRLQELLDADHEAGALLMPLVAAGGKRLRPALLVLAATLAGDPPAGVVDAAAAVELIHTATLVHDDLIDRSPTRRGTAAVHAEHGAPTAILLGDHYLTRGFSLLAACGGALLVLEATEAVLTICTGELRQQQDRWRLERSIEHYRAAITAKTAALMRCCCRVGALVAGLPQHQVTALGEFGLAMGRGFQIADDIMDLIGTEADLGKPPGGDLREGTMTLPVLLALEDAEASAVLDGSKDAPHDLAEVVGLLRRRGALTRAAEMGRAEVEAARACLADMPAGPARDSLWELAAFAVDRIPSQALGD